MKYLLDSIILIDFFNRVPPAARWLQGVKPQEIAISAIAVQNNLTLITRNSKDFNPAVHRFV
ncbi:MAG: hypothetical protein HQL15_09460 [Candidatus Omnitrophica bacterium]|nr:hypothetical protein [Candidatus Omnitrophota bacterium]